LGFQWLLKKQSLKETQAMDDFVQSSGVEDSCEESSRVRSARILQAAQNMGFWWRSPRQVAMHLGVSDNTLRFQLRRHEELIRDSELPPAVVRFLESPEGIQFLHTLLVALHLVFVLANDCGLRAVRWFLRLTGLDKFIASSYGAQQSFAAELETKLADYGREEETRLAAAMAVPRLPPDRLGDGPTRHGRGSR
jgi:hypothetical protein